VWGVGCGVWGVGCGVWGVGLRHGLFGDGVETLDRHERDIQGLARGFGHRVSGVGYGDLI